MALKSATITSAYLCRHNNTHDFWHGLPNVACFTILGYYSMFVTTGQERFCMPMTSLSCNAVFWNLVLTFFFESLNDSIQFSSQDISLRSIPLKYRSQTNNTIDSNCWSFNFWALQTIPPLFTNISLLSICNSVKYASYCELSLTCLGFSMYCRRSALAMYGSMTIGLPSGSKLTPTIRRTLMCWKSFMITASRKNSSTMSLSSGLTNNTGINYWWLMDDSYETFSEGTYSVAYFIIWWLPAGLWRYNYDHYKARLCHLKALLTFLSFLFV